MASTIGNSNGGSGGSGGSSSAATTTGGVGGVGGASGSGVGGSEASASNGSGAATSQAGAGGTTGQAGAGGATSQAGAGGSSAGTTSGDPTIVDLFNGTDLSGWSVATGWPSGVNRAPLGTAEAEALFPIDDDGTLHVYRDAADGSEQPRATLMTDASYGNYKLWVEYRWGTKKFAPYEENPRDAGILFHITGDLARIWPSSIEFQILEGQTGDLWVLRAKCTSLALNGGDTFVDEADGGTTKAFDGTVGGYSQHQRSEPFDSLTDWNQLELTVIDDTAEYVVNGHLVNKVFDIADAGGNTVTEGPIALQAEYSEVFYRNVRLQELP